MHLPGAPRVGAVAVTMSPGSYQHFTIFVVELLEGNKAMYKPCAKFEGRFQVSKSPSIPCFAHFLFDVHAMSTFSDFRTRKRCSTATRTRATAGSSSTCGTTARTRSTSVSARLRSSSTKVSRERPEVGSLGGRPLFAAARRRRRLP